MAFITTGLTDFGSGPGVTAHFALSYDDALNSTAHPGQPEPARTNALIAQIETDYDLMSGWFGGISLSFALPISVKVANAGGGASWGPPITLNPGGGDANLMRYLLVAEVTEMFMLAQNRGWFAPDGSNEQSSGEGLSHFLATQFLLANGLAPFNAISNLWLNSSRDDWVNQTDVYDNSSSPKSGCALLFLYYLHTQLGFSNADIVAAAAPQLSGVYHGLTEDPGNPFPFFKRMLDVAFPGTGTITHGPNFDDPYPLGLLSFWVEKNSFGRDEVQDAIATSGGVFPNALWLIVEGFSVNSFNALGVTNAAFSGTFASLPGIQITRSALPMDLEDDANSAMPQRLRIAFDVRFTAATLAAFPAAGSAPANLTLESHLNSNGNVLPASNAATLFELVSGADPYFTDIDPAQGNEFWLSRDLRIFTAVPGQNNVPVPGGPVFASDSVGGAFTYIQQLLAHLNSDFSDPGGADPFATVLPGQADALNADSSVSPFTFDFSNIFDFAIRNNYSFAIAKVRLRGTAGPAGAAQNVRVFFRLWSTQTADTDYQVGSTYPSSLDAAGLPMTPLVGVDHHTIPFFATGNFSSNSDYAAAGVNNRTVQINAGDQVWAYFGCFLNLYDPGNAIDGQQIQRWLNGTHHCIVAQIAYDEAPIINANGITYGCQNSDKLAQRNLQVTLSDNPGAADTHRIPQTFDIRPSASLQFLPGSLLDYPDELMIEWGQVPVGSVASIYWPSVSALQVVGLAERIYASHLLETADAHTIRCRVTKGVTYIPIPQGVGENIAGLFTIDLPTSVVSGQEFNVIVRRIASRRLLIRQDAGEPEVLTHFNVAHPAFEGPGMELIDQPVSVPPADKVQYRNWRYVVGAFQVKIPVTTGEVMLPLEENTLAIMRWRLGLMPQNDRWYPVLQRYISYVAARVDGLGGDSGSILPSPRGIYPKAGGEHTDATHFTGTVHEIVYDCSGRVEWFVLQHCGKRREFKTCGQGMGKILLRACKAGLPVTVFLEPGSGHRARRISIHCRRWWYWLCWW